MTIVGDNISLVYKFTWLITLSIEKKKVKLLSKCNLALIE